MPGIGDLIGDFAKNAVKDKIGKGMLGEILGEQTAAAIGNKVNHALEKVGVQKVVDGAIVIKLPFMKSVEKRTQEALAVHPEWTKICAHMYDDSIQNETVFYDLDGNVLYKIKKRWRNLKHVELLQNDNIIGVVQKKLILIKSPLSFAEPYKYSLTLHGTELGCITIQDQKMKAFGKPDFDSWQMNESTWLNHKVLDGSGNTIAEVWDVTENNYIFDCGNSFDIDLLILAFIAFEMRKEEKQHKR